LLTRDTIEASIVAEPAVAWLLLGKLAERVRTLVERVDRLALDKRDHTASRIAACKGGGNC
jgi:hypothetical protein